VCLTKEWRLLPRASAQQRVTKMNGVCLYRQICIIRISWSPMTRCLAQISLSRCAAPLALLSPVRCRDDVMLMHDVTTQCNSLMPGFHHSVAVSPLPLRKFRKRHKKYVAHVKNSVAPLPFQLPLRRNRRSVANRIESNFCRSSVAGQPISVLVIVQTASTERRFHQFRSHAQRQR